MNHVTFKEHYIFDQIKNNYHNSRRKLTNHTLYCCMGRRSSVDL